MMERGALGELIPDDGYSGQLHWVTIGDVNTRTQVYELKQGSDDLVATFYGDRPIRLERVALFLTTEQS